MTDADLIFCLSIIAGLFFALYLTYLREAIRLRARVIALDTQLKQADARARAESHKATMARGACAQANGRATLIAKHKADLEAENKELHDRVLYLTGLIRAADAETIARMNVMVVSDVRLANDTINLN